MSCTSNYLPAPAATSPTTAAISPAPVTTSPDYQRLPVLHQQSSLAPATRSCTIYQFLDFTIFPITIRHNKIWPFETTTLFCHSCLVRCQSLVFQKFVGSIYLSTPPQIEPTIDFTYELNTNSTLFFLDILLISNNNKLEFKVHYTSTNENDLYIYIHKYLSKHLFFVRPLLESIFH